MPKKSRSKGYMLVEIILASAIAFAIAYLIINLTIRIKNKNDDLMTTTLTSADQTIVSNKLSALLKEKGKDFDCGKLEINGKTITYDGNPVDTLNEYASYNIADKKEDWCYVDEEGTYIKINLPIEIKQQQDEYYDVNLYQEIGANKEYLNCVDIINSYNCENKKARIELEKGNIIRKLVFPQQDSIGVQSEMGQFMNNLTLYNNTGTNPNDDAPDSCGMFTHEIIDGGSYTPKAKPMIRPF